MEFLGLQACPVLKIQIQRKIPCTDTGTRGEEESPILSLRNEGKFGEETLGWFVLRCCELWFMVDAEDLSCAVDVIFT